ncbi:MAG: HlyD family secretion protein, partial [Alphaproteobacteria bacterium]
VVDAYPDLTWTATIESISPATGAEFALLPPQNATGNWVKVVQRVPVRLHLVAVADAPVLRAGMTVTVSIDTKHERDIKALVDSVLARTLNRE